jgi:hypothetical protein
MKKVVLASLLACAAIASGLPSVFAQQPVNLGTQPSGQIQMPADEFAVYNNAVTQTDPKAQAAAYEAYLTQFPQSSVKVSVLEILVTLYGNKIGDSAKTLDAADRLLQVDPNNITALYAEAAIRKGNADALTDAAAKQAGLDTAAGFAQKALAALAGPKPAAMADADFKTLQTNAPPTLYSVIGYAANNKKDSATAIDAYKKELAFVPVAQTQTPGGPLLDTYYLGIAYLQATPPDYLNCSYYFARFAAYAPEPYKSQAAPYARSCYKNFHGTNDGYDDFAAKAQANLNPPDGLFASIKPKPTPADIINGVLASTPDLSTLAPGDMEFILANGTPDQTQKVWDSVKGKARQFPGVLVVSSTPTQVLVAISDDSVASKTADFTFNLAPPDDIPEPKPTATPAQKLAYKKAVAAAQKTAADVAAATAPGQTVTLDGTYDSFTPNPTMIIMSGAEVELPKPAAKPAGKPAATVHHTAPAKKP